MSDKRTKCGKGTGVSRIVQDFVRNGVKTVYEGNKSVIDASKIIQGLLIFKFF